MNQTINQQKKLHQGIKVMQDCKNNPPVRKQDHANECHGNPDANMKPLAYSVIAGMCIGAATAAFFFTA
jgi:hypothetical protein